MATATCHLPPLLSDPASPHRLQLQPYTSPFTRRPRPSPPIRLVRATRRRHPDAVVVVPDARPWVGDLSGAASYRDGSKEDEDGEEDDEDEGDDRSLDLLARFLHSVFRKASRRARRAARSVLPPSVPAELVKFSVNGVLVLTFLWILKGLLELVCAFNTPIGVTPAENLQKNPAVAFIGICGQLFFKILVRAALFSFWKVVCTFGSMVFISILLVRGIWSGVTYIKENRYSYVQQLKDDDNRWSRVQTSG